MKVLITGGAGYIGTELIAHLQEMGEVDELVIYDNLSRDNYNLFLGESDWDAEKIRFVKGDILDSRKLHNELEGIDVVYHLAARVTTPFADENAHLFEQINHWGTAELVYAIEESDVSHLIHVSSASVYGSTEEEVDIDSPLNPRTFYGISKQRGEEHVRRLSDKIPVHIVRCGNVYGYSKSMRFDAVINKFIFEAHFNNRITVHGDGSQYRAFIHINRAAACLSKLLISDLKPGSYNLVENNFTIREIVEQLERIYPDLEKIFVDQHLQLREIQVAVDPRINALVEHPYESLEEEMRAFRDAFSF